MSSIYRTRILWGLAGLLAGVLASVAVLVVTVRSSIIDEYQSSLTLPATVEQIVTNAQARGWRVTSHPLEPTGEVALEKHADHIHVIHLCNNNYTEDLLAFGRNRSVAMVPSTIVVYQQGNAVRVAHVDNAALGRFFRRESAGAIRGVRQDEKEIFGFLAKR